MKIEELDFTVRTYHALKRAGINTTEELVGKTDDDLYRLRNIGKLTVAEIREKLPYIPPEKTPLPTMTIGDKLRAMFATDEGIAELFLALDVSRAEEFTMYYCDGKNNCIDDGEITCNDEMRKACILRWLHKPAEETPRIVWPHEDKDESGLLEED